MPRKFFVGGNFKMNGLLADIDRIVDHLNASHLDPNTEVLISPPAIYLLHVRDRVKKGIEVAAQNCYSEKQGAFTGEISPLQIADSRIPWVIIGHSERRTLFGDHDHVVAEKVKAALEEGLNIILCVGETLEQREKGETLKVVEHQLDCVKKEVPAWAEVADRIVIAYEPVWAIGTGRVATASQAQEVHSDTRTWLASRVGKEAAENTRIIYGGSVSAKNCQELATQPDLDGFLVGGASLKPEFVDIINSHLKK
ncbi:triosephosphate isomerase [Dacryopinax primogenitus]|uniref:Triosephosphate isomerase n=1 Tax=Dacryopinax primogenitus (strain DJM 731) TaxID=1858805 RepID=M5FR24_DACPD|nr:triosephosphate isomerase [Dacryopinax primogenitus]EJT99495.1 triosephosphate isomerase [Dacryopinax primogenitus]